MQPMKNKIYLITFINQNNQKEKAQISGVISLRDAEEQVIEFHGDINIISTREVLPDAGVIII